VEFVAEYVHSRRIPLLRQLPWAFASRDGNQAPQFGWEFGQISLRRPLIWISDEEESGRRAFSIEETG